MTRNSVLLKLSLSLLLLLTFHTVTAAEIRVAVASNFNLTMKDIVQQFEIQTEHTVTLIVGSTGKHYAQIINGAPYDIFFAADTERPQLLESRGKAIVNSRFTYALGKIVLWSPQESYIDATSAVLSQANFRFLAIANPKLAPYGKAAQEVLQGQGYWDGLSGKLVRGENISQTLQFVKSGNAQLGFVALSQVMHNSQISEGSYWQVPQALYTPIEQQALLLKDNPATQAFITFVQSKAGQAIIQAYGYDTP